jgi:hypothetical protein
VGVGDGGQEDAPWKLSGYRAIAHEWRSEAAVCMAAQAGSLTIESGVTSLKR